MTKFNARESALRTQREAEQRRKDYAKKEAQIDIQADLRAAMEAGGIETTRLWGNAEISTQRRVKPPIELRAAAEAWARTHGMGYSTWAQPQPSCLCISWFVRENGAWMTKACAYEDEEIPARTIAVTRALVWWKEYGGKG